MRTVTDIAPRTRIAAAVLLTLGVGALAPAAALARHPGNLSLSAGYGPSIAAGDGAGSFDDGRGLRLDVTPFGLLSGWIVRVGHERFDHSGVAWLTNDRLFAPSGPTRVHDALVATHVSLGVRRGARWGPFRAHLEGLTGASWTEIRSEALTSRRPDPARPTSSLERQLTPSVSMGLGMGFRTPWSLELSASVATRWSSSPDLAGAVVPILFGATWPAPDGSEAQGGPALPLRLRLAAGWSAIASPTDVRRAAGASPGLAVEVELPIGDGYAVSLAGEHAIHRDEVRTVAWQEIDQFGNLVDVYGPDQTRSFTVSTATLGIRRWWALGAVRPSIRAGLGWGRTGGFGETTRVTQGAYLQDGQWVPVTVAVDVAGGEPRSGLAYAAALGLDVPLRGALDGFVEVGGTGLSLRRHDVFEVPIRAGIALRSRP